VIGPMVKLNPMGAVAPPPASVPACDDPDAP